MVLSSTDKLPVVTQSQGTCFLADTDDTSASPLPWRTNLEENTSLLDNSDEPGVSPLRWRTKLKEKRANKKWQSKLNGLQTQIAKSRENLFLLEAALQNTAATGAAVQPEMKPGERAGKEARRYCTIPPRRAVVVLSGPAVHSRGDGQTGVVVLAYKRHDKQHSR